MARRRSSSSGPEPSSVPHLTVPRDELDRQLEERIIRGSELQQRPIANETDLKAAKGDYRNWHEYNVTLLQRSFSSSELAKDYDSILHLIFTDQTPAEQVAEFRDDMGTRIRQLKSVKERLELYDEETSVTLPVTNKTRAMPATRTSIFVVHGHSDAAKQEVARFLEQVSSLSVIILHERPNAGRTIMEKFEDHAGTAAFAVVLLTGDDEGGLVGSGERQRRARQNVVFELGFFIGTLGRARVAVLYEEGVELPSDMSGVLYTPLDPSGAWRFQLAKEMHAADIEVDLNRALDAA